MAVDKEHAKEILAVIADVADAVSQAHVAKREAKLKIYSVEEKVAYVEGHTDGGADAGRMAITEEMAVEFQKRLGL